jgi:hypothetical protein
MATAQRNDPELESAVDLEAQAEQKGQALPVSDVLAGAPQHHVAGADHSGMRTEQELMGVALLVDLDIRAGNGVIQGITILRRAEPKEDPFWLAQ